MLKNDLHKNQSTKKLITQLETRYFCPIYFIKHLVDQLFPLLQQGLI